MLKFLTKPIACMTAAILVATSVFGQDSCNPCPKPCAPKCEKPCPQPTPPTQLCPPACPDPCCPPWPVPVLNAAYSYPAGIKTRCPWDISFDASFIYWQPLQESMQIGGTNSTSPPFATNGLNIDIVNLECDYKPGFKVGLGWNTNYDNWDLHAEYTWFHCTQTQSASAPAGGQVTPHFGPPPATFPTTVYNSGSETWRLRLDTIDLDIGRWMYVGTKLVVRPYAGARAAWIRQDLEVVYTNLGTLGVGVANVQDNDKHSSSWAIGPRGGLDVNWNLGAGFRFFTNNSADILFTRYTSTTVDVDNTNPAIPSFSLVQKQYNTLRARLDMDLGIGWGTYWDCNNWYTDIALGYEFQVFFDQNVLRINDYGSIGAQMPVGNMYLHGLTAKFSLDF